MYLRTLLVQGAHYMVVNQPQCTRVKGVGIVIMWFPVRMFYIYQLIRIQNPEDAIKFRLSVNNVEREP